MKVPSFLFATGLLLCLGLSTVSAAATPTQIKLERRVATCSTSKPCADTLKQYCGTNRLCKDKVVDGKSCTGDVMCLNGLCQTNSTCVSTRLTDGLKCALDTQCVSTNCKTTLPTPVCGAKVAVGATCRKDANCLSGYCNLVTNKCAVKPVTSSRTTSKTTSTTSKTTTTTSKTTSTTSKTTSTTSTTSSTTSKTTSSTTSTTATSSTTTSQTTTSTTSTTTSKAPENTYPAVGPGQACTMQGGCLGAPAFVCLNSVCTAAGGAMEPCQSGGLCPKDASLFCSAADNRCHVKTKCDPQCDPTKEGCLAYTATPAPGISYTAYSCIATTGEEGKTCLGEGTCKGSSLYCDTQTNTCKAVFNPTVSTTTTSANTPAPTTCSPSCDAGSQVCNSYVVNKNKVFYCQPAGALAQPCLANGSCTGDNLRCNAQLQCEMKPQSDCYPACSAQQICLKNPPFFSCIDAGGQGQPPYVSGECMPGLAVNSAGVCDKIPVGGSCQADSWCQSGLRCVKGLCAVTGATGQPCSSQGACNTGNYCLADTDTCTAYGAAGGSCPGGLDSQCVTGLRCINKVCKQAGTLGEPCLTLQGGCSSTDLTCDSATSTCQYTTAQGADAACLVQKDCSAKFRCLSSATASTGSSCQAAGNTAQPCLSTGACLTGNACVADVCQKIAKSGEACSETSPCADGYLCTTPAVIDPEPVDPAAGTPKQESPTEKRTSAQILSARAGSFNIGVPLPAWHPLWQHPARPAGSARDVVETSTQAVCVRAGIRGSSCYANGTCSAANGAVCDAASNKCVAYYAKFNETCTKENTTDIEGADATAYCDKGLRCKSVSALFKYANGTYYAGYNSNCVAAGAVNQTCLWTQTSVYDPITDKTSLKNDFACNSGLACTAPSLLGTCQYQTGGPCTTQAECASGNVCKGGSCVAAGGLNQPCMGSVCNAGYRCNNSTGTPTCKVRNSANCEDLSLLDMSTICTDCKSLCSLSTDGEAVSCRFSAGKAYSVTLPRGINNVSLSATSGGGGNATVYKPNWSAVTWPKSVTPRVIEVRDGIAYYTDTNTPVTLTYKDNSALLDDTGATVPLTNTTRFGGVGSTVQGYFPFQPLRTYLISVGDMGSAFNGGYNGGGSAMYDPITNSSAGGGGGRTSIVDQFNSTEIFCLGGGGGAGYLAGGGAAGKPGNGTDGYGLPGASGSTAGSDATILGVGAGGAGCNGGTAGSASGSGGGGGLSTPAALVKPNFGLALTVNYTLYFNPLPGYVGMKFSCGADTY
ncbi:unnamed protein product [Parajaminaea phylloscopi]